MIGIYKITNDLNQKVYIGQSVNIYNRWLEHLRSGQPDKYSYKNKRDSNAPIHLAMQKYGIEHFSMSIIKECEKDSLDEWEKYYIAFYKSNNKLYGYNITEGGQSFKSLKGELHSQAKLTQKEVNQIKTRLKQGESVKEVWESFSNKVGRSTISLINTGKIWTDEKEQYPLNNHEKNQQGSSNGNAILNEKIVMQIRNDYVNLSFKEIVKKYSQYNYSLLKSVVYGESWKFLPIYKKSSKKWIEPCIDYSQSLK